MKGYIGGASVVLCVHFRGNISVSGRAVGIADGAEGWYYYLEKLF